jgi:hypothetical protein
MEFKAHPDPERPYCLRPRLPMQRPLLALSFAAALSIAQADVYRWVDEQGVAHYSDQWVPGSEVVKTSRTHPPGTDTAGRTVDQKNLTAATQRAGQQLRDEQNARATQQEVAARRAALCKSAKDAYMRAITARVVYKDDKDTGQRTFMSEADADAYRANVRQAVQDNCGSVPQFDPEAPIPEPQPIDVKPTPEPKVNPADATSR